MMMMLQEEVDRTSHKTKNEFAIIDPEMYSDPDVSRTPYVDRKAIFVLNQIQCRNGSIQRMWI